MRTSGRGRDNSRFLSLAQFAGLIATAWFVLRRTAIRHDSLAAVFAQALVFAMLAWVASAIVTFYILLIASSGDVKNIVGDTARRSAVGMWFAPAIILLTVLSPVALAASIGLAMNTTRLLVLQCVRPRHTKS